MYIHWYVNILLVYNSAGDTGNELANKWLDSENRRLLHVELDPLLEKAIGQPVGLAPRYTTSPLTQVHAYVCVN